MTFRIAFDDKARKQLSKLDNTVRENIIFYLSRKELLQSPQSFGKALSANLKGYWRYRVGDYRIICDIREKELIVLIVEIGHRKNIYD